MVRSIMRYPDQAGKFKVTIWRQKPGQEKVITGSPTVASSYRSAETIAIAIASGLTRTLEVPKTFPVEISLEMSSEECKGEVFGVTIDRLDTPKAPGLPAPPQ